MDLLSLSRVTADAECRYSVKPPFSFANQTFLGNAVTSSLSNGKEFKDWIYNESILNLWRYFLKHQIVVTYNGLGFDYPLWGGAMLGAENVEAQKFFENSLKGKTIDLCKDFHETLGARVSLENVSVPTLGDAKEMQGGFAPDHWREGRCFEVVEYCRGDVRRTDALFVLAAQGKPLKVRTKDGQIKEFTCIPKVR